MNSPLFRDRIEAGRLLAETLEHSGVADPRAIVLGLPRGGIPVAVEVAQRLKLEMDALIVRKVGAPDNPEFGIGAVTEEGVGWLDDRTLSAFEFDAREIEAIQRKEKTEVERRVQLYRRGRPLPELAGRLVLLVDDGLATGVTAVAAARLARHKGAARVILAVPVAASDSAQVLRARHEVDALVAVREVPNLGSIGAWYEDFSQVSDSETLRILDTAQSTSHLTAWRKSRQNLINRQKRASRNPESRAAIPPTPRTLHLTLETRLELTGDLVVPANPIGLVIFAHGSGSSRMSPRNRAVAHVLNETGIATFLMDLLTPAEETDRSMVFDVELLASRLLRAARQVHARPELHRLPLGFFGASTGAAAALLAAADLGSEITAVVSRGGRPDLAHTRLAEVAAPTLLIVGGMDPVVLELNEAAVELLPCARIAIIEGATHLFEEHGALEAVADESARFFEEEFTHELSERMSRTG